MTNTNEQYDAAVKQCRDIFIKKTKDYGTAWRVLRTISVVDQVFIKALRIRTIQEVISRRLRGLAERSRIRRIVGTCSGIMYGGCTTSTLSGCPLESSGHPAQLQILLARHSQTRARTASQARPMFALA